MISVEFEKISDQRQNVNKISEVIGSLSSSNCTCNQINFMGTQERLISEH